MRYDRRDEWKYLSGGQQHAEEDDHSDRNNYNFRGYWVSEEESEQQQMPSKPVWLTASHDALLSLEAIISGLRVNGHESRRRTVILVITAR